MSIMDRLEGVISRHAELTALMATGDLDVNKYADYAKEYAELSPVVERAQEMKSVRKELAMMPIIIPNRNDNTKSSIKKIKKLKSRSSFLITVFAAERHIANNIITKTSLTTVTPIDVLVNGPFAFISFMTAIAEEGDLATKITPNSKAIISLMFSG